MLIEAILFVVSIFLFCWYYKNPANYPATPPFWIPIYGHSFYVMFSSKTQNETMIDLYKKYSKNGMLALDLGTSKMILMGDFKWIKEGFKMNELNYRFANFRRRQQNFRHSPEGALGQEGIINR